MMSTQSNLQTRVAAILNTWGRHDNVRLDVFIGSNGNGTSNETNASGKKENHRVIRLPTVWDDDYPPQKKGFAMIKYIHDNHLNSFDWFLRLDDDAYVKVNKLKKLLRKLDPSRMLYIGQPGFGRDSGDYMREDENYCMGGPGQIISRALLKKIGPHLSSCLRQLLTEHEDLELGRCIRRVSGVNCTLSWETKKLFHQHYGSNGTYESNIKSISEKIRDVGVTFHANKDPIYQLHFHQSVLDDKMKSLVSRIVKLEGDVLKMGKLMSGDNNDVLRMNFKHNRVWDSLSERSFYHAFDQQPVVAIPNHFRDMAVKDMLHAVDDLHRLYASLSRNISSISIKRAAFSVNPLESVDTISKLKFFTTVRGTSRIQILEKVHFQRRLPRDFVLFRESSDLTVDFAIPFHHRLTPSKTSELTKVNFIIPLSGRQERFQDFLSNYEEALLSIKEKVSLIIVYYPQTTTAKDYDDMYHDGKRSLKFITTSLDTVRGNHTEAEIHLVVVDEEKFSRGAGLQIGTDYVSDDELIFFCDIDINFDHEILYRIRRNTVKGRKVYYPVFFSQYNPDVVGLVVDGEIEDRQIHELKGFWRSFSYGMVSMYKSDFLATGGFDLNLQGWGFEDLLLADSVMSNTALEIFRVNDPAMIHPYHDKYCSIDLSTTQRKSCQQSRAEHFGSKSLLSSLWMKRKYDSAKDESVI